MHSERPERSVKLWHIFFISGSMENSTAISEVFVTLSENQFATHSDKRTKDIRPFDRKKVPPSFPTFSLFY